MVELVQNLDDVFHALAHDGRRQMLARLSDSELTVGELAQPLPMSFAAASKHVKVLEDAGLVRRTIEGRRHVLRLDPTALASAVEWLRFYEHFWQGRLDALEALVKEPTTETGED